ncbi:MAG TPA: prepilin-type N-terminal cleavage/methylation domain-containing protein [Magnetospirillaceae bacterium]|jgi:general secretion pathway protein I
MHGFTILETLVALVVAAAILSVLYGLYGTTLGGIDAAEASTRATLLAQSRLESVGVARPLHIGVTRGQADGGYSWIEEVQPKIQKAVTASSQLIPFVVRVTVSWHDTRGGHSLSLDSIRLAAAQ